VFRKKSGVSLGGPNSYFEFDVYDNKSNLIMALEDEDGLIRL